MKVYLLALGLLLNSPLTMAMNYDQESCIPLQCGQIARLRMSAKGTEKLMKLSLDSITRDLDLKKMANEALNNDKVKQNFPLESPVGIRPKKIISEAGRITILSDIEAQEGAHFFTKCLHQGPQCNVEHFLNVDAMNSRK